MHWWVYPLAAWFLAAYCVTLNWQLRRLCDPTHTANRVWHRSAWHKVGLVAACALMFLPMLALWWVLLEPWRSNDPDALAGSYELHESGLRRKDQRKARRAAAKPASGSVRRLCPQAGRPRRARPRCQRKLRPTGLVADLSSRRWAGRAPSPARL
jgi:hypothetical protein